MREMEGGMGRWAKWMNGANVKKNEKERKEEKNQNTNIQRKDGHPESGDKQRKRERRERETTRSENIHVPAGRQCAERTRESPASSQRTHIANHVLENHILFLCFLNAYLRVPSLSMSYSFSSFLILIHHRYALKITLITNLLSSTTTHTVQAL